MTTPKTLVIGSSGYKHVTCIAWENIASINLKDFDVIVANVKSLSDRFLKKCERGFFDNIRHTLSSWLTTGGELIILGEKIRHIQTSAYTSFTNYSWLPVEIGTAAEEGTTIEVRTSHYAKYIERFQTSGQWKFYYFTPTECLSAQLKNTCGGDVEYKVNLNPIAQNRSQEVLSGIINITFKNEDNEEFSLNPIVLLPHVEGLEEREAIRLILEDRLSLPQEVLPPAWTEIVPMPLVDDIQLGIDEKMKTIAVLQQEIAMAREEKSKLETFKKLLYGSGHELENLFADCLELLGGKIVPANYADEEFLLEYKNQSYLVECKGVQKSTPLAAVRQLMDYMLKFEEDEGYAAKGILFSNAWSALPPEYRGQDEAVIFPNNVIEKAETLNIALLSSVTFFDEFCDFLAGKVTGEEILDKIVSSRGVVEFEQIESSAVV